MSPQIECMYICIILYNFCLFILFKSHEYVIYNKLLINLIYIKCERNHYNIMLTNI